MRMQNSSASLVSEDYNHWHFNNLNSKRIADKKMYARKNNGRMTNNDKAVWISK